MKTAISSNPVYDLCLSYQKTAALQAAIALDLFSVVGGDALTADELAARTHAALRGIRILCDFLCVLGLLEKRDGRYCQSADAARFLDRASPQCLADVAGFLAAPETVALAMGDPAAYVKAGTAACLSNLSADNPAWVKFARAMVPFAAVTAKRTAAYLTSRGLRPQRVLDVAAGHGLYGIEVARAVREATVVAIDWDGVLACARENAARAGVSDRYETIAGSVFERPWGTGYDLILLPNILHHFDREGCVKLLRLAKDALRADGFALVIDLMPNPDRVSPPEPATFAFLMLVTTPAGDAYTCAEYEQMARDAGLQPAAAVRLLPTPETLLELRLSP